VTYSIVARDPHTDVLGVAVQTAMLAVGATVPWVRAGVGAVATQAIAEPAYGPRCLDALEAGASAQAALDQAVAADEAALIRQVGVVAADGSAAAMTGGWCIDHAGHLTGDGFAVQANMMASDEVWHAMAEAFSASAATAVRAAPARPADDQAGLPAWSFARRLLGALEAGQAAGGDARGMMSAALVVADGRRGAPWEGRVADLRAIAAKIRSASSAACSTEPRHMPASAARWTRSPAGKLRPP
jgi:uncharacterized Ntn-hydrolase superfamily protein